MLNASTLLIIGIVLISIRAWKDRDLFRKLIFNPYQIENNKEWYRFLSSGFIHADTAHLAFNCITLFFFGDNLLDAFRNDLAFGGWSSLLFILLFVLGVIISSIPSYLQNKHTATYNSLGASGGVSSILFASILVYPLEEIGILFIPFGIPGFIFGILYLIYSYYMSKKDFDKINHSAHFIGSVFGIIFMLLIEPDLAIIFFQKVAAWRF